MKNGKITFEDLKASGPLIQYMFGSNFPDGLKPEVMKTHETPWVRRAYARWKEEQDDGRRR
jgi:hypothetical protein